MRAPSSLVDIRDGNGRMTGNVIETVMGGVVLVVAALFLFFAYSTSQVRAVQGYQGLRSDR